MLSHHIQRGDVQNHSRKIIRYYWKYHCRGCGKEYHRDEVHSLITERLSEVQYTGTQQEEFTGALSTVWRQRQQDKLQEVKSLRKRLGGLQNTKSSLVVEMATTDISLKEDIRTEIDKTKASISDIEDKINRLSELDKGLIEFVKFGLEYTDELMEDWWQLGHEDRVRCQQLVFPGGISFNSQRKVGTTQISALYTLEPIKKDLRFSRKSLLVELPVIATGSDGSTS